MVPAVGTKLGAVPHNRTHQETAGLAESGRRLRQGGGGVSEMLTVLAAIALFASGILTGRVFTWVLLSAGLVMMVIGNPLWPDAVLRLLMRGYHPQLATVASTSDVFDEYSMSIMAASVTSSRTQVMYVVARTWRRPPWGE